MLTSSWSIRWKLTAWYIAALLVILLVFSGLALIMMNRYLYQQTDLRLKEEARELAEEITFHRSMEDFRSRFDKQYAEHGGFSFQVSQLDGTVLCGSPWLRAHTLPRISSMNDGDSELFQDVHLSQLGLHRVFGRISQGITDPLTIHVVVPHAQTQREFRKFSEILLLSGSLALLLACFGGLKIAHHALQPLERITQAAEKISSEHLAVAIDVANPRDELGRLAATLNDTFRRLRNSVGRIQRFTADAAHELRTPLSVMKTRMEVALRGTTDLEQLRECNQIGIQQADRLSKLIDQLLTLSREDAGIERALFEDVCLSSLLKDVADSLRTPTLNKRVALKIGQLPDCSVLGNDISLSRLFFNLLENAIKYTPSGGTVHLSGWCDDRNARLVIADTGVGIDASHLPYLFDRFYRVDSSRNDQSGGAGLGLAICKSIVAAHQGEIVVTSLPDRGTTFTVTLPVISTADQNRVLAGMQHA